MGVGWVGWVGWMSFLVSHASVCSQKFSPHLLHLHLEHRHLPTELSSICLQYAAKVFAAGQVYVLRSIALFQEHGSSWIRHVGLPNHKHSKKTTQKKYSMTNLSKRTWDRVNTLDRQSDKQPSQARSLPITSHVCCLGSSQPVALQLVLLPLLKEANVPNTANSFKLRMKFSKDCHG